MYKTEHDKKICITIVWRDDNNMRWMIFKISIKITIIDKADVYFFCGHVICKNIKFSIVPRRKSSI